MVFKKNYRFQKRSVKTDTNDLSRKIRKIRGQKTFMLIVSIKKTFLNKLTVLILVLDSEAYHNIDNLIFLNKIENICHKTQISWRTFFLKQSF